MLLLGSHETRPVVDVGSFECPHCQTECTYQLREVRQWLTVYFIPVLRVGTGGRFVECDRCRGRFAPPETEAQASNLGESRPREASAPEIEATSANQEDYVEALLVLVACDQGTPRGPLFECLRDVVGEIRGRRPDNQQLGTLIEQGLSVRFSAVPFAARISPLLSAESKIKAIVLIDELVRCPGATHPTGWKLLEAIAGELGFRPAEVEVLLGSLDSP